MNLSRWQHIEQLYHAALVRPPAERAGFLSSSCAGDEALRAEVESLLSAHEKSGDFLSQPEFDLGLKLLTAGHRPLHPAQKFGEYTILELLGRGGMGEVYLAKDARLGRKIALKLLPSEFTRDEERVRRFRQEARAVSALNYPNILTIHEVGEAEGRHYIVTEFIDGETLRQRLNRSRMSLSEVLDVAVQVAGALGAAHQAGIVHRDIKPENIMLRHDHLVKVLDFSLAKLAEQQPSLPDTQAFTLRKDTTPGLVVGTVKYMSPEQARGVEVDARSDVFSFGVVLYEMLTGHAPFQGETASDLIATILKEEPAPLSQCSPDVPEGLQRINSKAMRKDKEERYQSIQDLLADLKDLKEGLEIESKLRHAVRPAGSRDAVTTSGAQASVQTADELAVSTAGMKIAPALSSARYVVGKIKRHKTWAVAALAAIFISTAAIGYAVYEFAGTSKLKSSSRNIKLTRLTTSGKASGAAISPDGKYVAYVTSEAGQNSVWIRQVPTSGNVRIVPPSGASYWGLTFSRDGNYLYYMSQGKGDAEPALFQMPSLGGVSRKLIEGVVNTSGNGLVTLSPDGRLLAFVREYPSGESAVVAADADGTGERRLMTRPGNAYFTSVAWSPDGTRIACAGGRQDENGSPYGDVVEVEVGGVAEKPITTEGWSWVGDVAWFSDGSGLLITAMDKTDDSIEVWQIPYPNGPARKITTDLNGYTGLSLTADSSALVTTRSDAAVNIWTQPEGDAALVKQITTGAATNDGWSGIAWTPDGKIVYSSRASGRPDLWMMDADGGNQKQLTVDLGSDNFGLSVSPDGRHIVFVSHRAGKPNIWRVDVDGGNAKQLTGGNGEFNPVFLPNGQWVSYMSNVSGSRTMWRVPVNGGKTEPMSGPYPDMLGTSPDGRLTAYIPSGSQSQRKKIAVGPSEGGEPLRVFDLPPSAVPRRMRWSSPDGRTLTYIVNRGGVSNIWSQPIDGGPPRQLTDFKAEMITSFAWSLDGKQLALARGTMTSDVVLIKDFR